jgi:hypothetical protein
LEKEYNISFPVKYLLLNHLVLSTEKQRRETKHDGKRTFPSEVSGILWEKFIVVLGPK